MDFSAWDNMINKDELSKQINEAKENGAGDNLEAPAGNYICSIEKMELGSTKDERPMFRVQLRVIEAGENAGDEVEEYLSHFKAKKPCLFMNRVLAGTKNDANMIASVIGWLEKLETETVPEFKTYSQFADNVLDIYEEVVGAIELEVSYDPDAFNSISIKEVYEA